jgi:succinate dehydrogenase/fumarate reductase flavoprotein subunit
MTESAQSETLSSEPRPLREVAAWELEHDVVIVGHGVAGGAAAIEAAGAGAETLVLERMSRGGGATALSTGLTYFGGGTAIQKACGFEDSLENMIRYVRLAAGSQADPERVRLYCEGSIEHFEWFRALGVEFKPTFYPDKVTHPLTDDCLVYSGNEEAHPFVEQAQPVPRGHKPAREGEAGGYLMEVVLRATLEAGARVVNDCLVETLIQREDRRVVGVVATLDRRQVCIKARRGVILAAGGFIMNREMLARHSPELLRCKYPLGTPGDDGRGIRMGVGAGAEAIHMNEGLVLNAYYPPSSHLKGVLVDARGQRFINEDAYVGRTGDAMLYKADGKAFLVVDDEIYGQTQAFHRLAAVEESFEGLERELGIPEGALVHTLEYYNRHAEKGEDPLFHKAKRYLRPLSCPPYAALDCSADNSLFAAFTLGGLAAKATGEVLSADGAVIPGLYAAGRNTAGLCCEGRTYASGMSIGDASFFGRLAGRQAAQADSWE